jgi:hypothetical protein
LVAGVRNALSKPFVCRSLSGWDGRHEQTRQRNPHADGAEIPQAPAIEISQRICQRQNCRGLQTDDHRFCEISSPACAKTRAATPKNCHASYGDAAGRKRLERHLCRQRDQSGTHQGHRATTRFRCNVRREAEREIRPQCCQKQIAISSALPPKTQQTPPFTSQIGNSWRGGSVLVRHAEGHIAGKPAAGSHHLPRIPELTVVSDGYARHRAWCSIPIGE